MVATGHTVNRLPWQRASGKTAPQESTHLTLLLLTLMMMKRSGSFYLFIERPDGYLWNLHKSCRWFLRRINFIKKEEKCNKNIPKIFRWFRTPIRHESRDVGKMEWNFTFFFPVQRGNCPHTEEFYLHFFSFILIKFYLILLKRSLFIRWNVEFVQSSADDFLIHRFRVWLFETKDRVHFRGKLTCQAGER